MEDSLTGSIDFWNIDWIIVNTNKDTWTGTRNQQNKKEESKECKNSEVWSKEDPELHVNPEIYSIKDITDKKTELQIIDIIRNELDIKEDDLYIWNKMLMSISQISLSKTPRSISKEKLMMIR